MKRGQFGFTQRVFFSLINALMTNIKFFIFIICLITPGNAFSASLEVGGTGASLGTMMHMARAYMKQFPNDSVTVLPSMGSGGGIKALAAGKLGLSFSGRPLKEKEIKLGLKQYVYAKSPFIIAVKKSHPKENIALSELENILLGKNKSWPDKTPIRLIMRHERESDTKFLRSISPEIKNAVNIALKRKGVLFAVTDQETADLLEKLDGSIATSTLTQIISENRNLKALSIESLTPSVQSLQSKTYPYFKTFHLVSASEPSEVARRFKNFIFSKTGQDILVKNGCLPQ